MTALVRSVESGGGEERAVKGSQAVREDDGSISGREAHNADNLDQDETSSADGVCEVQVAAEKLLTGGVGA